MAFCDDQIQQDLLVGGTMDAKYNIPLHLSQFKVSGHGRLERWE